MHRDTHKSWRAIDGQSQGKQRRQKLHFSRRCWVFPLHATNCKLNTATNLRTTCFLNCFQQRKQHRYSQVSDTAADEQPEVSSNWSSTDRLLKGGSSRSLLIYLTICVCIQQFYENYYPTMHLNLTCATLPSNSRFLPWELQQGGISLHFDDAQLGAPRVPGNSSSKFLRFLKWDIRVWYSKLTHGGEREGRWWQGSTGMFMISIRTSELENLKHDRQGFYAFLLFQFFGVLGTMWYTPQTANSSSITLFVHEINCALRFRPCLTACYLSRLWKNQNQQGTMMFTYICSS